MKLSKPAAALQFIASRGAQGATTKEITEHVGMRGRRIFNALGRYIGAGYVKKKFVLHLGNNHGMNLYTRTDKPMPEKTARLCSAIIDGVPCENLARHKCRTCCNEHAKISQLQGSHKHTKAWRTLKTCRVLVDGKPCGMPALPRRRCCSDEHARLGLAQGRAATLQKRRVAAIKAADERLAAQRAARSKPKPPKPTKAYRTAQEAAERLMQFWHAQNFTEVRAWVEPVETPEGVEMVVRSNLQSGLAPSQVGKAA